MKNTAPEQIAFPDPPPQRSQSQAPQLVFVTSCCLAIFASWGRQQRRSQREDWRGQTEGKAWEEQAARQQRTRASQSLAPLGLCVTSCQGGVLHGGRRWPPKAEGKSPATIGDGCPALTLPPAPRSPHRSPTGSSDTARLPLSWVADPRFPDCGTVAGKGRKERGAAWGGTGRCLGIEGHASAPLSRVGQWPASRRCVTGCWENYETYYGFTKGSALPARAGIPVRGRDQ
ncbi:unnamed protein product [Rangifer tarandus platyrhynchus]|uniref:Uncharacterized protein n=1 Tax=Rangifer tarandus platyrhynchus TaxID=3082113 RepID=A0ABN8ZCK2_RANTA|nr:unnamed protein product [Rangifer tarandus platyrhynchus]CAI9688723.1 unnamed protein product [Rangifer tarandus platyrhynchus]